MQGGDPLMNGLFEIYQKIHQLQQLQLQELEIIAELSHSASLVFISLVAIFLVLVAIFMVKLFRPKDKCVCSCDGGVVVNNCCCGCKEDEPVPEIHVILGDDGTDPQIIVPDPSEN